MATRRFLSVLLASSLALSAARPAGAAAFLTLDALDGPEDPAEQASAGAARQDELYEKGTSELDAGRWDKAEQAFSEAARLEGKRIDAALYWRAYAESRLGKRSEASATLAELKRRFPKSRWLKDAAALDVEMGHGRGKSAVAAEGSSDDELKLIAINGIMGSDPERAVPLLEKVLAGKSSPEIKERALFVLSQSGSPRALTLVAEIARGRRNPELQDRALQVIGISGGKDSVRLLGEIYASTPNPEVKERILQSYMVAGEKGPILAAAKGEKSAELRAAAAHLLGAMGAIDELWQLYLAEPSIDVKDSILNGFAIAGAADRLAQIAKTEKSRELRSQAIQKLGIISGTDATLVSIYKSEKDPEVRDAALQGLFILGNARALIELARTEKDRQQRAEIVQKLSVMDTKESAEYMLEILSK
ncbi:MAG: HEAT repeat domain-containing protein [Thermoanaerobaculia bacterium]